MKYDPNIHHRRSVRLKGFDYACCGLYFVTICSQNRLNLFGDILDHTMVLNTAGKMLNKIWQGMPDQHKNIRLYEYVVMPNHFHAIIEITSVGADSISARTGLGAVVQTFKRFTTVEYIKRVKQHILPAFDGKIWQRNYWEHIIRNEDEATHLAQYIIDNPRKWALDKLNNGV
ncbi:MAG: transposase [Gammaproteobacteria bacterium]|nr:transposase [Gammaproteobacteria bacterium]